MGIHFHNPPKREGTVVTVHDVTPGGGSPTSSSPCAGLTRALSHSTGEDMGGCVACQDEAVNAYLNDEDMVPSCETPTDDGEGFCAVCGHRVTSRFLDRTPPTRPLPDDPRDTPGEYRDDGR